MGKEHCQQPPHAGPNQGCSPLPWQAGANSPRLVADAGLGNEQVKGFKHGEGCVQDLPTGHLKVIIYEGDGWEGGGPECMWISTSESGSRI